MAKTNNIQKQSLDFSAGIFYLLTLTDQPKLYIQLTQVIHSHNVVTEDPYGPMILSLETFWLKRPYYENELTYYVYIRRFPST